MKSMSTTFLGVCALLASGTTVFGQTWDWAAQIATFSSGGDAVNKVTAITIDLNENVFITGDYGDSVLIGGTILKAVSVGDDMYIAKLSSSGQFVWSKNFGSADVSDQVLDITGDPGGSVYVRGYFTGQIILDTIHLNGLSVFCTV